MMTPQALRRITDMLDTARRDFEAGRLDTDSLIALTEVSISAAKELRGSPTESDVARLIAARDERRAELQTPVSTQEVRS